MKLENHVTDPLKEQITDNKRIASCSILCNMYHSNVATKICIVTDCHRS